MAQDLVEQITHKRDSALQLIETLTNRAAEEGRELTDEDNASIDDATVKVRKWNDDLGRITADLELSEETVRRLRGLGSAGAIVGSDFRYRSDGHLLWDVLHLGDMEARRRYDRVHKRAAEHMGTLAANTTPVAGDLAGLVVKPVVGPVIVPFTTGMPLASALGIRDMPASDGFGFSRPQIVDASFETGVGVQTLEKAELASKAFSVTTTPVSTVTIGGYLNISAQLLAFNSSALDIILAQMRRRLENAVDKAALAELDNSTGKITLALTATAAETLAAIYDASAAYYGVTKTLPTTLVVGPAGWARLGSLVDAAGRPLFPTLGATNAPGTSSATSFAGTVAGLRLVVTPAITDEDLWVVGPDAIELYGYAYPGARSRRAVGARPSDRCGDVVRCVSADPVRQRVATDRAVSDLSTIDPGDVDQWSTSYPPTIWATPEPDPEPDDDEPAAPVAPKKRGPRVQRQ